MRLTDATIRNFRFEGKQRKIFDDGLPNFGVRIYQSGVSFVVMLGTERRMRTIGKYPAMSLKEARSEALKLLERGTPPKNITAQKAIEAFLEHCERHTSPRTKKDYERLLNRHFPSGKMASISRQKLLTKLSELAPTPGEQSHASTAFNVFLNWCSANGYIPGNPIAGIRNIGKIQERDRTLTADELKTLYNAAIKYGHPFGHIIALCILTGQRRSEIANLRWSYIGPDTITFPASITKNRREHTIPYSFLTEDVLSRIPHEDDLLFKGRGDNVWNGWSKTKRDFDPLTESWQIHDLRRTFASIHAETGTPIHIIEKLLNHVTGSLSGVTGIYNRYNYQTEMRTACMDYEKHLRSLV